MRRAVARGRIFPQSYSTDRRYGRLSIKAIGLYPLMWANADDQGRLPGDPEEIKYRVCPNIDGITKTDVAVLLLELQENKLILIYKTPKISAIQLLDWWDVNFKLQWAWPSEYQPPDDWTDHLRYKKNAHEIAKLNWPVSGEDSGESENGSQVSTGNVSGEDSGEDTEISPPNNPSYDNRSIKGSIRGSIRGNTPERSGETQKRPQVIKSQSGGPHPHQVATLYLWEVKIFDLLKENYSKRWGNVRADRPTEIIPRQIQAKAGAQLRDLAVELAAADGFDPKIIKQAFDEAAGKQKFSVSYVRAILFAWLGLDRSRPKIEGGTRH